MDYRKQILPMLIPYFEKNDKYFLLYGDTGFGGIDKLKEKFEDRCINVGIREQSMVGIAAGMAMVGFIPIVYAISNFLVYRALEQIRNDVVLQYQNVKFIGTGVNNYFNFLGKSHTCDEDDIKICDIIKLQYFNPYEWENCNFEEYVKVFMQSEKAGYIRV